MPNHGFEFGERKYVRVDQPSPGPEVETIRHFAPPRNACIVGVAYAKQRPDAERGMVER